jgi:hypothetical protein
VVLVDHAGRDMWRKSGRLPQKFGNTEGVLTLCRVGNEVALGVLIVGVPGVAFGTGYGWKPCALHNCRAPGSAPPTTVASCSLQ